MTIASRTTTAVLFIALFGIASSYAGQGATAALRHFPGGSLDQRTLKLQKQVESLYRDRDFERALLIYRRDLAPVGDKYAQYMVGYMTLTGRGVSADPARALAWYELAAERREMPYIRARDALAATLDGAQQADARMQYAALWRELGDRSLLLEQLQTDIARAERYDDEADASDNALLFSGFMSGTARLDAYRQLRDRIDQRLAYLDSLPERPAHAGDADIERLQKQLASIRAAASRLPDY